MTKTAIAVRIPTARRGPAGTSQDTFRRDVEGLRGLAVALIVLFDAGVPGLGGGYAGADVLFVISGYVIATLLLSRRFGAQRAMPFVAGSVVGGALAWSILHPAAWSDFSVATRAWEIGAGALVALAGNDRHRIPYRLAGGLSWFGLVLVVTGVLVFRPGFPLPGIEALIPALGTVLVLAGRGEGLLGLPPARWLGRLWWPLLLGHVPVLIIAGKTYGDGVVVLLTLGLALVTYAATRPLPKPPALALAGSLLVNVVSLAATWWTLPRFGATVAHVPL